MPSLQAHLHIYGKVQGVFYRASTQQQAQRLGLAGWVRNRPDGSVEVLAEGNQEKVEALIAWCRQGPPRAQVDHVQVERRDFQGQFVHFSVLR